MKKVLVPSPVFSVQCPGAVAYLEEHGVAVIQNQYGLPFSFEKYAPVLPEIDGVIAGVEVWDGARMDQCPRLKILARFGIGVDNFDLPAARERGIVCTNAPGLNTNAVAEHTMSLILALTRRIVWFDGEVRRGQWVKHPAIELRGRTLGLIGCGAIARRVAGFAQAFGMETVAYDAYPDEAAARAAGIRLLSMEEVLCRADVVSVHVPGTASTRHLMDEKAFARMREHAFFVNTSRGTVVDETALYHALAGGRLAGAAADVFEQEPVDPAAPLMTLPNFIATPHTAAITQEANRAIADSCARAVVDCLEGRRPEHVLTD